MKFSMAVLYSSATVKGAILRPVITAHGHFRILKIRYPDVKTHIISHECFLRGAIITAWADQFRQQQGELWFVEEEISDSNADTPWHFKGNDIPWLVAKSVAALGAGE